MNVQFSDGRYLTFAGFAMVGFSTLHGDQWTSMIGRSLADFGSYLMMWKHPTLGKATIGFVALELFKHKITEYSINNLLFKREIGYFAAGSGAAVTAINGWKYYQILKKVTTGAIEIARDGTFMNRIPNLAVSSVIGYFTAKDALNNLNNLWNFSRLYKARDGFVSHLEEAHGKALKDIDPEKLCPIVLDNSNWENSFDFDRWQSGCAYLDAMVTSIDKWAKEIEASSSKSKQVQPKTNKWAKEIEASSSKSKQVQPILLTQGTTKPNVTRGIIA